MFERIEAFFQRLNVYTEVAPNQGMVDTIAAILVEVLNFIGIATKEIKQGRTSKRFLYIKRFSLTMPFSEKYLKKAIRKNDIEDVLRRLDTLTQEARMATSKLPKVPNTIDNRVGGIADSVLVMDHRVAVIDDRVAGVDERVPDVDEDMPDVDDRVACVGDRMKDADDQLVAVINGAQYTVSDQSSKTDQLLTRIDGKEASGVIEQAADDVDQVKRSWSPNCIYAFMPDMQAQSF